jgi:hypothetical protein
VVTLDDVLAELRELRRLYERLAPPPPPDHDALVTELEAHTDGPFTSAELLDHAGVPLTDRAKLARLLQAMGAATSPHDCGMVLAAVARSTKGQPLRLVRAGRDGDNANLWTVEREPRS